MILAALVLLASPERELTRSVTLEVGGVHCADCLQSIRTGLSRMADVRSLNVAAHPEDATLAIATVEFPETAELDADTLARFLRGFELRAAAVDIRGELVAGDRGPELVARGSGQRFRLLRGDVRAEEEAFDGLSAAPAQVQISGRLGERTRLAQELTVTAWAPPPTDE